MAKGRRRKPRKPPDSQFRGPREETSVWRGPEDQAPGPDRLAEALEQRSGGSIPAEVARRVSGEWPELAAAVAGEMARREGRDRDPASIHPSLAGLGPDDDVPLIIAQGDEPPAGAGPLLGKLDATAVTEDGTSFSGANVWLQTGAPPGPEDGFSTTIRFSDISPNLRAARRRRAAQEAPVVTTHKVEGLLDEAVRRGDLAPGEIPAAYRRQPGTTRAKIITKVTSDQENTGIRPGDIIATARPIGFTETGIDLSGEEGIKAGSKVWRPEPSIVVTDDPGTIPDDFDGLVIEDTDPGDDSAPVRISHGKPPQDDFGGLAIEAVSSAGELPDWFEVREPQGRTVHHMSPSGVLDAHERLTRTMRQPPARLLEFFGTFIDDAQLSGDPVEVSKWAGSFWPARTASEWCGVLAGQLSKARTYHVTAGMVDKTDELYHADRDHVTWTTRDDIPWEAGFAYLDKPAELTDRHGNVIYNRAYSWDLVYLDYEDSSRVPGIRVVSWSHPEDRDSYWSDAVPALGEIFGGLVMANSVVFPFGQRFLPVSESDSAPAWVRCLWIMIESVISATRRVGLGEIDRRVRRRAQKSLLHGEVNVVLLRRSVSYAEPGTGHRRVDWTCRWPVGADSGGFWRHSRRDPAWERDNYEEDGNGRPMLHHAVPDASREHCIRCGMKITHVGVFFKGPPGLPIRQRKQLYKLAR